MDARRRQPHQSGARLERAHRARTVDRAGADPGQRRGDVLLTQSWRPARRARPARSPNGAPVDEACGSRGDACTCTRCTGYTGPRSEGARCRCTSSIRRGPYACCRARSGFPATRRRLGWCVGGSRRRRCCGRSPDRQARERYAEAGRSSALTRACTCTGSNRSDAATGVSASCCTVRAGAQSPSHGLGGVGGGSGPGSAAEARAARRRRSACAKSGASAFLATGNGKPIWGNVCFGTGASIGPGRTRAVGCGRSGATIGR